MKKLSFLLTVLLLTGCVSAKVPQYIPDENPYVKEYYVSFDNALAATKHVLEDLGWEIANISDPEIYEHGTISNGDSALIFTEVRHTALFLGSRYTRMNVIVRGVENKSIIEIRYFTVNSLPFRNITTYKHDMAVNRIFRHISELLES